MQVKKAQILLTIIFILTFSLFSIFLLLVPIKNKLLKIKEMESIYQAFANAEKGIEISLFSYFKQLNYYKNLNITTTTKSSNTLNCYGITYEDKIGECIDIRYTLKNNNKDKEFEVDHFIFIVTTTNDDFYRQEKIISNGIRGKNIRSLIIGLEE